MSNVRKIFLKIGIDKAIAYTSLTRIIQGAGGLVSVTLIALHLSGAEQGFYYTFGSILAVQIFLELGLSSIMIQFVAHEKAQLIEKDDKLHGDERHLSRLSSLIHFCIKWYSVLSIIIMIVLSSVGYTFFLYYYKSDVAVSWKFPWFLLALGTSLNVFVSPFSSILEGLGKVKEIAYIRLIQQISTMLLVWAGLIGGLKLYVVIIPPFVGVVTFGIYFFKRFGNLIYNLYNIDIKEKVLYIKEIFPYQWKLALSWISGYFIFQLFNPVLFAVSGPVVAGQMGMTLTILNAIGALSMSWIYTKIPLMSGLIARREYVELDRIFNTALKQVLLITGICLVIMFLGIYIIRTFNIEIDHKNLGNRLIPYLPMIMMMLALFLNQYTSAVATYLRCHKQEPFMWISIIGGITCCASTIILGKMFGVYGVTIGYFIIILGLFPWGYNIYIKKKKIWHAN